MNATRPQRALLAALCAALTALALAAPNLAERYGWINRALPADALDEFVRALAHRIAAFPAAGQVVVKDRVNAISLAPLEDFRRDSDLFGNGVRTAETQRLIERAMARGLQTRDAEMELAKLLADLGDEGDDHPRPAAAAGS
jgi:hypothetical protein